jgi:hypothetical protein
MHGRICKAWLCLSLELTKHTPEGCNPGGLYVWGPIALNEREREERGGPKGLILVSRFPQEMSLFQRYFDILPSCSLEGKRLTGSLARSAVLESVMGT